MTSEQEAMDAALRVLSQPSGYYAMNPAPRIVAAAYIDVNDQIARLVTEIERLRVLSASAHRAGMEEAARIADELRQELIAGHPKYPQVEIGSILLTCETISTRIRAAKEHQDE